jgi:hypothetical protein
MFDVRCSLVFLSLNQCASAACHVRPKAFYVVLTRVSLRRTLAKVYGKMGNQVSTLRDLVPGFI